MGWYSDLISEFRAAKTMDKIGWAFTVFVPILAFLLWICYELGWTTYAANNAFSILVVIGFIILVATNITNLKKLKEIKRLKADLEKAKADSERDLKSAYSDKNKEIERSTEDLKTLWSIIYKITNKTPEEFEREIQREMARRGMR